MLHMRSSPTFSRIRPLLFSMSQACHGWTCTAHTTSWTSAHTTPEALSQTLPQLRPPATQLLWFLLPGLPPTFSQPTVHGTGEALITLINLSSF